MKRPVIVKKIEQHDSILEWVSIVDMEMSIEDIPFPIDLLRIVPVKWTMVSNFTSSMLMAVRKTVKDNPGKFAANINPDDIWKIVLYNLIETMSDLSWKWIHIFQAFADTKKGMKRLQSDDDLIAQMWVVEDTAEDIEEDIIVKLKKVSRMQQEPVDIYTDNATESTDYLEDSKGNLKPIVEYKITKAPKIKKIWVNRKDRDYGNWNWKVTGVRTKF